MQLHQTLLGVALVSGALAANSLWAAAPDHRQPEGAAAKKAKPYPLKTCVVSGEKFGGDMGEPYAFTHQDREIKLCCKGCLKDFNKEPAKYLKKLEQAEKDKAGATGGSGHDQHKQ